MFARKLLLLLVTASIAGAQTPDAPAQTPAAPAQAPDAPAQTPAAPAQAPDPGDAPTVFKLDVSLISVDAKVTSRSGMDIGNLTAADFVIYDENERHAVSHFGRESTPIDLLLVLDVSSSMRPFLISLTPQVTQALSPLRPGDRAGVMLFAGRNQLIQPLTSDLALVPRATVNSIYKDGLGKTTLLNEALVSAAQYLKSQPATGRRTIIVVTDDASVAGSVRDDVVARELSAADAVLNVVLAGAKDPNVKVVHGYRDPSNIRPDVYRLTQFTGGDVVTAEDPARALRSVIQQAITRYSLQYASPGGEPGSFRKVRVELTGAASAKYPGATIRARSGYDVPK